MIACDAHMHTRFSEDSDASVHSMLDAAVNKGMQAVCITDHLDKDFPEHRIFRRVHLCSTWMNISAD